MVGRTVQNKNKTSESIAGTMSNYGFTIPTSGYDAEDRLVSFNRTAGLTQSWNLSAVGDWSSVTTNGTAQSRAHGPSHELLTGAGSNVSTDVKGNITVIPASLRPNATSLTSTWDFDNRLSTAVSGSTTVSHKYDALGCRIAHTKGSTTTVFVPSGQQTICDYVAGAAPASSTYRYVYASYIDEPVMRWQTSNSSRIYYHRNQQYSLVALTNSSGGIVERYAYTAYGVPTIANASGSVLTSSAQNNRYTYTGREWDNDIKQYHYRARMYDASLGRFCSKDPISYHGSKWNLFALISAKVLQRSDPSGRLAVDVGAICRAKKLEYERRRVPEAKKICGDDADISVDCTICGDEKETFGFTECEKVGGRKKITIKICIDFIETRVGTADEASKEIATTLIHEDMHALDYCSCGRGCDLFTKGVLEPFSPWCQRFYCSEVRAHSVDGSCDEHANDVDRKKCIAEKLKRLYPIPKCKDADIDEAVERCYIKKARTQSTLCPCVSAFCSVRTIRKLL